MKNQDQMMGASAALVVLAAFFWGLSGGIGGILMADGWNPFVVSFSGLENVNRKRLEHVYAAK